MSVVEPADPRPDPPGWIVTFKAPLVGWEAYIRSSDGTSGPVWFTGSTRSDVLNLIYEYERTLIEKKRAEWCEEAQEVLEYIECQLELGQLEDDGELRWGPTAVAMVRSMVRRMLRSAPPAEKT